MEWTALFTEVLKLSPFVAVLLYFLTTVWKSMKLKDEALMATMREHQINMLQVQKESITAQNNTADAGRQQADANRQLAGAIGDLKEHLSDKLDEVKNQLPRNGSVRRSPTPVDIPKNAA